MIYDKKIRPGTDVNQGPISSDSSKDLYSNKDILIWNKDIINQVWNKLKKVKEAVKIKKKKIMN